MLLAYADDHWWAVQSLTSRAGEPCLLMRVCGLVNTQMPSAVPSLCNIHP